MQLLTFLLAYPFLWAISRLPFRVLYLLSDGLFYLLYSIIGYRKKVVRDNLQLVFPEKSMEERLQIERKFYAHLCDMFLEMAKTMGMSHKQLKERYKFENLEVLFQFEKQNRSVMLILPHYASWEWVFILNTYVKAKGYGIYQPINNKYFDRWARGVRGKFGTTLITTKQTRKQVALNDDAGIMATYGIISDQSPMIHKTQYWAPFMGITVPMHTGAESLCKNLDLPAVYLKVEKVRRGYYRSTFKVLTENPSEVPDYEITDAFFREVEKSIREAPEYYFWTHKRWKHRHKAPSHLAEKSSGGL